MDESFPTTVLNASISFTRRPFPITPEYRPLWGMSLLTYALFASRATKSSRSRLQVLLWAIRSDANADSLLAVIDGRLPASAAPVRYDPTFEFSLSLCLSEQLADLEAGKMLVLAPRGRALADAIAADTELLAPEKQRLTALSKRLTETVASDLLRTGAR